MVGRSARGISREERSPGNRQSGLRKRGNRTLTTPETVPEGSSSEYSETKQPAPKRAKPNKPKKPTLKRKRSTSQNLHSSRTKVRFPRRTGTSSAADSVATKASMKKRAKDQLWAKDPPPRKYEKHVPRVYICPSERHRPRPGAPVEYYSDLHDFRETQVIKRKAPKRALEKIEEERLKRIDIIQVEDEDEESYRHTALEWCTQECLLGQLSRRELDGNCPNVKRHAFAWGRHVLRPKIWLQQVKNQLDEYFGEDCKLRRYSQSSRGALFKLTFRSHGYCLIAKGVVKQFVPDLLHEARVYEHLQKLHGIAVPVYMGNFALEEPYELDNGLNIAHMLFLAWGGNPVKQDMRAQASPTLQDDIKKTIDKVREAGIIVEHIREENTLWNTEIKSPMLVDFERAVFAEQDRGQSDSPTRSQMEELRIGDFQQEEVLTRPAEFHLRTTTHMGTLMRRRMHGH